MNRNWYEIEITFNDDTTERVFNHDVEATNPVNALNDMIQGSWRDLLEDNPSVTIYHFENHITDVRMSIIK